GAGRNEILHVAGPDAPDDGRDPYVLHAITFVRDVGDPAGVWREFRDPFVLRRRGEAKRRPISRAGENRQVCARVVARDHHESRVVPASVEWKPWTLLVGQDSL